MKLSRRDFIKSIACAMVGFSLTGFKAQEPKAIAPILGGDETTFHHVTAYGENVKITLRRETPIERIENLPGADTLCGTVTSSKWAIE